MATPTPAPPAFPAGPLMPKVYRFAPAPGMDVRTDTLAALDAIQAVLDVRADEQLFQKADRAAVNPDLATKVAVPLPRPSGEMYHPRKLSTGDPTVELWDTLMLQAAYDSKIPVLLYGPPGTGKTALADSALPRLITFPGSGDTEVADFIGSYVQNADGTFTWVDGPLVVAMVEGRPFLIDEIALIDSKVMAVVYSVMDGRNDLRITANPSRGTIKAEEGFYVVGACNPDVPGAVMSEALTSRFLLQMEVLTDFDLAQRLGVQREIVTIAKNLKKKREAGEIMRAPQMRELLAFKTIAATFGMVPALANFAATAEAGDRPTYVEVISNTFGKKIVPLVIG